MKRHYTTDDRSFCFVFLVSSFLALFLLIALPAALATASDRLPHFSFAPNKISPNQTVVVVGQVPENTTCGLTVRSHRTFVRSQGKRSKTGLIEFIWKVPRNAAAGKGSLTLSCAGSKRSAFKSFRVTHRRNGARGSGPAARLIRSVVIRSTAPPAIKGLGAGGYPAYGAVQVPGSAWFGGSGVNVYSNGYAGNLSGNWQCVELVNRFLTTKKFGPAIYGNAQDLFANAPSTYYEKYRNGSGHIPVPGDVIVLGGGSYGHVVIVDSVSNGTVYAVEQNSSSSGRTAFSLKGSTLSRGYGLNVIGIIHAKANQKQNPPDGPFWGSKWQMAFNAGTLWSVGFDVRGSLSLGVAPGTSPSLAVLKDGSWIVAFQAPNNHLWVVGSRESKGDMGLGMAPGTSPSITALDNGSWQVAWNANGALWTVGPTDVRGSLGYGISPGTSPSITGLKGGGWQVAWNAEGALWTVGRDVRGSLGYGIAAGTSPSIAALANKSWQIAWNGGGLWTVGPTDVRGSLGYGIAPGTSPSITGLANGSWQIAWNAGDLWTVGPTDVRGSLGYGIAAGTSPQITGLGQSWQIAWNADGAVWTVGPTDSRGSLGYGIASGTSPSISS